MVFSSCSNPLWLVNPCLAYSIVRTSLSRLSFNVAFWHYVIVISIQFLYICLYSYTLGYTVYLTALRIVRYCSRQLPQRPDENNVPPRPAPTSAGRSLWMAGTSLIGHGVCRCQTRSYGRYTITFVDGATRCYLSLAFHGRCIPVRQLLSVAVTRRHTALVALTCLRLAYPYIMARWPAFVLTSALLISQLLRTFGRPRYMAYNVGEYMSATPLTYYMTVIPSYVQACMMVTYHVQFHSSYQNTEGNDDCSYFTHMTIGKWSFWGWLAFSISIEFSEVWALSDDLQSATTDSSTRLLLHLL